MLSNILAMGYTLLERMHVAMHREEGQTMAEYGLLLAVIAVVVVVAALVLGSSISSLFSTVVKDL
jgi:pilus assembly protein Flp/PilA